MEQEVKVIPILLSFIGSSDSNSSQRALQGILEKEIPKGFSSHYVISTKNTNCHVGTVDNEKSFYSYGIQSCQCRNELLHSIELHDTWDPEIVTHKKYVSIFCYTIIIFLE